MTSSPLPEDPYGALSLQKTATTDQIRSSYRKLVLKAHPDRFPQASPEEKQKKSDEFHKIQQAYELLTDDTRRQRYDERVHLAELKAELLKEQAASGRKSGRSVPAAQKEYTNGRSFNVSSFETRGGAFYEERVPKPSPQKVYDEDYTRYESATKYDDYRSSPRVSKADDSYKSSTRKTSTKEYDEMRRGGPREERDSWDAKAASKEKLKQEKERERQAQSDKKKARDKVKRQESEAKQYYSSPRIPDEYSETDSSDYARRSAPSSKKRTEASRRGHKDERSTRHSRGMEELSDFSDERSHNEFYQRQNSKEQDAWNYIKQATKQSSDPEDRPRVSARTSSKSTVHAPAPPPPPPPPAPPKEKSDSVKRSSASKKERVSSKTSPPRESRSSRKEKPFPEIIEPEPKSSRRTGYSSTKRPSLKTTDTAPARYESEFRQPTKASTWQPANDRERERDREREFRDRERERDRESARKEEPKPIRRSQTNPLEKMVEEKVPQGYFAQRPMHGASKLRRSETAREPESDSELDSPGGYGGGVSPNFLGKSRYAAEPEEIATPPHVVTIEPSDLRHSSRHDVSPRRRERTRSRDVSPSMMSKRPSMPARGSGSHRAPMRSSTAGPEPSPSPRTSPRPPLTTFPRQSSNKSYLYGEIKDHEYERPSPQRSGSSTFYTLKDIQFAPPLDSSKIKYSERQPSTGGRDRIGRDEYERSRERSARNSYDRDAFGSRHGPSTLGRQASHAGKAAG